MSASFRFECYPSVAELQDVESADNLYIATLGSFQDSLNVLENQVQSSPCRSELHVSVDLAPSISGGRVAGEPAPPQAHPDIFAAIEGFCSSGVAASLLYKVIKLWSDARQGRKILYKIPGRDAGSLEVTNMSEKQFLKLAAGLQELEDLKYQQHLRRASELANELASEGARLLTADEVEGHAYELGRVYSNARESLKGR